MRTKPLLIAAAALAIALPAIAQQTAQTQPPANQYPNGGIGATQPQPQPQPSTAPGTLAPDAGAGETGVQGVTVANLRLAKPVQLPIEYP